MVVKHGPLDNRLGVSEKGKNCETCGHKINECPGHFGYLKFEMPVFHIGFFKHIVVILKSVCKVSEITEQRCARLLLTPEERRMAKKRYARKYLDSLQRGKIFHWVV